MKTTCQWKYQQESKPPSKLRMYKVILPAQKHIAGKTNSLILPTHAAIDTLVNDILFLNFPYTSLHFQKCKEIEHLIFMFFTISR